MPHEHHVFVDFENVPSVDLAPIADLPVTVTVLLGGTQNKLDTDFVEQIHRHAAKVQLVRLAVSGRNALDLTLAYYLGRAVQEQSASEFHIVSKDRDFDPLITHLRSKNLKISRADSFASLSFLSGGKQPLPAKERRIPQRKTPVQATPAASDERVEKVFTRLGDPQIPNRPSTERALRSHLKATLGKESSEEKVQAVLGELIARSIVSIDAKGKVVYGTGG